MVLIELYDAQEPIQNVISLTAFQPDTLVLLVRGKWMRRQAEKSMQRFIAISGMRTNLVLESCDAFDLNMAEQMLQKTITCHGVENCIIDVMGGDEVLLLAAGSCAKGKDDIRIVTRKRRAEEFIWLKGEPVTPVRKAAWPLEQIIALAGGELVRNARVSEAMKQQVFLELIPKVFAVYMKHRESWPEFVLYMQRLKQTEYQTQSELEYCAPGVFYAGRRRIDPDTGIFMDLKATGAITAFSVDDDRCFRVQFASAAVLKYLCDVGAWLELYGYYLLKRSGMFDEVQMSAVISWDYDSDHQDVVNEIDLVALDGQGQLFISCKTASPDNMVLHEIATLTRRFGVAHAIPVLMTASNLEKESPAVYRRAAEMGIAVFDCDDLAEDRFMEKLKTLQKRWCIKKEGV